MITDAKVKHYLQKILSSQEFSESKSYADLLEYLVQASIKGKSPKELTIASEVFHKKINAEPGSDTTVRVYIHNLRKKLDSYYLYDGKDDTIKLSIPKGRYEAKFTKQEAKEKTTWRRKLVVINILVLLLLLAINFFYIKKNNWIENSKKIPVNSPVWSDFLHHDKAILIVFGDWYLYNDYSIYEGDNPDSKSDVQRRHRYIRDPQINSKKELDDFLATETARGLVIRETEHTVLGKFATWCMYEIFPVFMYNRIKVELKLSSKLLWEDFNNYNTIYIGSYKSYGLLKNIVQNLHTKYQVFPNSLNFYDSERDTTYSYQSFKEYDSGYHLDYTLIAKIPGPNQNTIMVFAATGDLGHTSSVKYFTVLETLQEFEKTYLQKKPGIRYFEALMEVKGFERTGMSTKLLHFKKIDPDYSIAQPE
ncbi:hypothetical protein A2V82_14630 [candidate division KSB1 bacterium RBG_16_48_16]|nr:MAG: hypothetical protein A2V82_14630 [candidate division KSB1 bacterium RBG_16_48_16]